MKSILESLPKGADDEIMGVINGKGNDEEKTKQLQEIFGRHKDALNGIGLDPDYLAYVVIYQVVQSLRSHVAGNNGHTH